MMSKQNQLRLYRIAAMLLVVVLMAGAYVFGSLSNRQTLAAQHTPTPDAHGEHAGHGSATESSEASGEETADEETAGDHQHGDSGASMMDQMQGMMETMQGMMGRMESMSAEDRATHMAEMMEMMQGMMSMMEHGAGAASGGMMGESMPMQGMEMHEEMDSMMGDMQGMMTRMQAMMDEMHASMPMGEMDAMMGQMDEMMSMMETMQGMMGGGMMDGEMMGGSAAETAPAQTDPAAEDLTRSAAEGAVTVTLTPLNLYEHAAATLTFSVTLETHTVDLPADLAALAVLRVGDDEIAASGWETEDSGHHIAGTLSFPATDENGDSLLADAENITVVIQDLADVEERTFTWALTSAANADEPAPATAGHAAHASASGADGEVAGDEDAAHGAHGGPIPSAGVPDATETVGSQPLEYTEEDGVKVFELTARPVRWTILEGDDPVVVTAWSYNGTVPGPMIRITEGDRVRIVLQNDLPEATSVHWHGIPVPNEMDGMEPIQPGESYAYEFTAPPAGSFMYHSHLETDRQIMVGLYAPFIVDPAEPEENPPAADVMWMLSEWRVGADGETYPAMPMAGGEPNYFTINGKAYPDTEPVVVKKGDTVRIRIAAIGQFAHPMHLHGMNFRIVGYDGVPLPEAQQITRNTVPVNPGEVIDIEFSADNVGTWVFHCHVLHHVTNDGVEPGGLIGVIQVVE